MHLCIFDHQSTRGSDGLYHLVLCLPVRTLSGLFGEADYPPVNFIPALWHGWHLPIYFYFYKGVSQHLRYLLSLDYQMCPIWTVTWGIHSVIGGPFSFNVFDIFGEGSEVVSKYSQLLLRKLTFIFRQISVGISALVVGSSIFLPLIWRCFFLGALDCATVFPGSWCFLKFSEGLLQNCERRPGKFDSWLLLLLSRDEGVFFRVLPFSMTIF